MASSGQTLVLSPLAASVLKYFLNGEGAQAADLASFVVAELGLTESRQLQELVGLLPGAVASLEEHGILLVDRSPN